MIKSFCNFLILHFYRLSLPLCEASDCIKTQPFDFNHVLQLSVLSFYVATVKAFFGTFEPNLCKLES